MSTSIFEVTQVAQRSRLNFLPKHAGRFFMTFEALVFNVAERFSKSYSGGFWEFKEGKTQGEVETPFFYLVPSGEKFEVSNPNNYFSGELTGEAYGVGVTLMSLSNFLFYVDDKRNRATGAEAQQISQQQEYLTDAFYALRDYAQTLPEARLINKLID